MIRLAALLLAAPSALLAGPFELPNAAKEVVADRVDQGSYAVPLAPFFDGGIDTLRVEGALSREVWHFPAKGQGAFALISPFRQGLLDQGFNTLLDCKAAECGGFDFRFATEVADPPKMFVDIGDFHFMSARRDTDAGPEYVSLLASEAADTGYLQITRVGPREIKTRSIRASTKAPAVNLGPFIDVLQQEGHAVLEDLDFPTGSSALAEGDFASLAALAEYLAANPDRQLAFVGHTDAEGSLEGNIALSRKRAKSVAERLISQHGVNPNQLTSDGVGFLSPRASNDTEEGRQLNRRVEVIYTSTR